jgi:hypothetical protein
VDPVDVTVINSVSDPIQGIANDSIAGLHASSFQRFDHDIRHSFAHLGTSYVAWVCLLARQED